LDVCFVELRLEPVSRVLEVFDLRATMTFPSDRHAL
jgi:hypothetical protein